MIFNLLATLSLILMKPEHSAIMELLSYYLEKHPDQRFGQALFNLKINEFEADSKKLRDIYSDEDSKIIRRVQNQLGKTE